MKVVVSAKGMGMEAPISPIFGRCQVFTFVDSETMESTSVANPAINAAGGAGVQSGQFVVAEGAEAIITTNLGPNASAVIEAAGLAVFAAQGATVGEAVAKMVAGNLESMLGASVASHSATAITVAEEAKQTRDDRITELAARMKELRREIAAVEQEIANLGEE